jgi:HNH endonuclease
VSSYIPDSLKTQIEATDKRRCCYCLTSEANSGIPMTFDHILPRSKGGATGFENLCLACRTCNEFKSDLTEAVDPLTGEMVPLFNPRTQQWSDHFTWSQDSTRVEGLTATGRATITALRMNNLIVVVARDRWVISGWHPPSD